VVELRFPLVDDAGPERYLAPLQLLVERGVAARLEPLADRLLVYADDGDAALSAALATGARPVSTLVRRSSLEDVFLRLTGRTLVD
jgi:lipooligosaccharide transport system ATP-binding protein